MKNILFVCVHNSGRSQMAEEFLKQFGEKEVGVKSAGTTPYTKINSLVTKVMLEKGIDISHNKPKIITQDMVDEADLIITMGCSIDKSCPATFVPSEDWGLDDPQGKTIEEIRVIRDKVEEKTIQLLAKLQ